MAYHPFGTSIKPVDHVKALAAEMNSVLEKPLDNYTLQMLLREAYQETFRLNHFNLPDDKYRPLALVEHLPKQDYATHGGLYNTIKRFIGYEIHKYTGQSLNEFLDQPRDINDMIFETVGKKIKERSNTLPPGGLGPLTEI